MSALMKRAAKTIEAKNKSIARARETRKQAAEDLTLLLGSAGGAVGAAYVDDRWDDGEGVATLDQIGGLPTNIAIGGGLIIASQLGNRRSNRMARAGIAGVGVGMFNAGVYQIARDKLEDADD